MPPSVTIGRPSSCGKAIMFTLPPPHPAGPVSRKRRQRYLHSDIATWAHQFYGPGYNPPLVDVNVDGGPLNPECPAGDQCPPEFESYAGDLEVVADIETQLALAPDVKSLIVYNAPNDFTGQTELDEWAAIATANVAESVSSSWAACENDVTG